MIAVVCLLVIHHAINDFFDLILFVASGFKFEILFWL